MSPKKEKSDEAQTRDELLVRVGVRVKQLRNAAGLTQKQLAEAAEMTPAYIYLVEVGGQNITLTVLGRLAGVLGVSVVDLLQDAESGVLPADDALARLANAFQRLAGALQSRSARDSEIMGEIQRLSLEHKQVTQALLGGRAGKTRKES